MLGTKPEVQHWRHFLKTAHFMRAVFGATFVFHGVREDKETDAVPLSP